MEKRVFGLFVFSIIILSVIISASPTFEVKDSDSCDPGYEVMGLSDLTNAHGELENQDLYGYELCSNFAGSASCDPLVDPENKVIGLSSDTNGHGEIRELDIYGSDVCYSGLRCINKSEDTYGPCTLGYALEILTLSAETNAHIGGYDVYDQQVCCYETETPVVYVERPDGGEAAGGRMDVVAGISLIDILYMNGDLAEGTEVTFIIQKDGVEVDRIIAYIDANGEARSAWLIPEDWEEGTYILTIIVEVDGLDSISYDLEITVLNADFCDDYDSCGDYGIEYCSPDPCERAKPWLRDMGKDCVNNLCYCFYDTSETEVDKCKAVEGLVGYENGVRVIVEQCIKTPSETKDPDVLNGGEACDDGFIQFYYYDSCNLFGEEQVVTIACPSQVELPFFGFYNFIVTMLAIALIYYFVSIREHRKKK